MLLHAETTFGLNLLRALPATNESVVFSPVSIALLLSLVHSGAKGKLKTQIENVLGDGQKVDQKMDNYFKYISDLVHDGNTEDFRFHAANRLFVGKEYKIKNNYTGAENLDFKSNEAAKEINNYVKSATGNKIKTIVSKSSLKNAAALLVNAMSFSGVWEKEFGGYSTFMETFVAGEEKVQRWFMHAFACHRTFAWDNWFDVLILNYKNPEYRFAIFSPKRKYGLKKVLEKLDAARFQKLLSSGKSHYINTYIPKINVKTKLLLKDVLPKLGITDLFNDSADLSEIADELKITNGVHKARIQINEEGTVAAPEFSSVQYDNEPGGNDPIDFFTKYPFLFALVRENHPVLMGIYRG